MSELECSKTFNSRGGPINALTFWNEKLYFSKDGKLCGWNVDRNWIKRLTPTSKYGTNFILSLTVHKDCLYYGLSSGYIQGWNSCGNSVHRLHHSGPISALIVWNDCLYSGSTIGDIKGWNEDGVNIQSLEQGKGVSALTVWNNFLYSSSSTNGDIKRWNLKGECVQTFPHGVSVSALIIWNDCLYSTSSSNGDIKGWDIEGKCIQTFSDGDSKMSLTAWKDKLYSGSTHGLIKSWVDGRLEEQRKILLIQSLNNCESSLQQQRNTIDEIKKKVNKTDFQTLINELQAIDIQIVIIQLEKITTNHLSVRSYQNEIIIKKQELKKRCENIMEEIQAIQNELFQTKDECRNEIIQSQDKTNLDDDDNQLSNNNLEFRLVENLLEKNRSLIIDELSTRSIPEFTELKLIMNQIQSSIPKDRAILEQLISRESSRVMICVQDQSCKTEVSTLRDTLLDQLSTQDGNLEAIKDQLQNFQNGFTTVNESLGKVHSKLDSLTQSMVDFQLDLSTQLDALKEEEIDLEDIEGIIDRMRVTQFGIETLKSKKKLRNKDVMNLILSSIPAIHANLQSLNLSNQESLTQLQSDLEKKCEESKEDQAQLQSILVDLSQVATTVNEKMDTLTEDVINVKTELFELIQVDMNKMKASIVGELSTQNAAQYTEMKLVMTQIQSSIPNNNDRQKLEEFISRELSRVMICVQDQSCKTEVSTLRDTLLHQLSTQDSNLEAIKHHLQNGFTTINKSLGEVHSKLDSLTQSMVDFQLDLSTQLDALKEEEIDLDNIGIIVKHLGYVKKEIDDLKPSGKKLRNRDVLLLLSDSMNSMSSKMESRFRTINQDSLKLLQTTMEAKCEESKEDQTQLHSLLTDLSQVVTTVNQKMDSLTEDVINVKTALFELDLSKFQKEQKEELQNVYTLLKEINTDNSYQERQAELFQKLEESQSQLFQEMKAKLESKNNNEEDIHETLQLNALQNLESQLNFLLIQQLDLSKFQKEQKEELQNVYTLLKEINTDNSYQERQAELFQKLEESQSQLLQEMKAKLESKNNSEEDIHETLQLNALQNLESQLNSLLIQQERQTEIMIEFMKGQYELPKYFTILPKSVIRDQSMTGKMKRMGHLFRNPSELTKTKFKLFFHCGCCKKVSLCGEKKRGYTILDSSTLQKFAPIIKITVCLIRLSGTVIGFPFPTSNGVMDELDELSTKFIGEDYGEEFSEKIDNMFSRKDSLSLNIEFNGELKRTTDKCYRQLKALMETLDSNLEYTGLTKVEGGSDGTEKSIEWVCELCKEGFQAEGKNYKWAPVSGA